MTLLTVLCVLTVLSGPLMFIGIDWVVTFDEIARKGGSVPVWKGWLAVAMSVAPLYLYGTAAIYASVLMNQAP